MRALGEVSTTSYKFSAEFPCNLKVFAACANFFVGCKAPALAHALNLPLSSLVAAAPRCLIALQQIVPSPWQPLQKRHKSSECFTASHFRPSLIKIIVSQIRP